MSKIEMLHEDKHVEDNDLKNSELNEDFGFESNSENYNFLEFQEDRDKLASELESQDEKRIFTEYYTKLFSKFRYRNFTIKNSRSFLFNKKELPDYCVWARFIQISIKIKLISAINNMYFKCNLASKSRKLDFSYVYTNVTKSIQKSSNLRASASTIRNTLKNDFRPSKEDFLAFLDDLVSEKLLKKICIKRKIFYAETYLCNK